MQGQEYLLRQSHGDRQLGGDRFFTILRVMVVSQALMGLRS